MRTLILFGSAAACRTNYIRYLFNLTHMPICLLASTHVRLLFADRATLLLSFTRISRLCRSPSFKRKKNNITSLQHQIHLQPDHDKEWHAESRARMQIRNANATASTCRYHLSHHPLAKHCPQHGRVECIQRYIQLLHEDGISYFEPSY